MENFKTVISILCIIAFVFCVIIEIFVLYRIYVIQNGTRKMRKAFKKMKEDKIQKAMEKQKAEEPVFYDTKFRQRGELYGECVSVESAYNCPSCNSTLWSTDRFDYCPHCGQKLKWKEFGIV